MSNSVLSTYIRNALVKAGFPEHLKVEYSFSCCQGDGVAFYGYLDTEDLINLFNKLNPTQKRKQKMFANLVTHIESWEYCSDIGVEICRNWFGHRYSHWNTMDLDAKTSDFLAFFEDCEAQRDWYFPRSKVETYKALWDNFIKDLEEYIKDTSKEIEQLGYQLIEASPYSTETVFNFKTDNYCVELKRKHSEFYSEPFEWVFGDMDDFDATIEEIRQGKLCFADFEATVTDRTTGIELGNECITGLSYSPTDRLLDGYRKGVISAAIADARRNVERFSELHA